MASRSTSLMPRHHPSRRLGRGLPGRLEAGPNKGSFCILYACVIWFVQPIESTCPTILADALGRWDIVTCLRIDMFASDLDRLIDIKLVGAIWFVDDEWETWANDIWNLDLCFPAWRKVAQVQLRSACLGRMRPSQTPSRCCAAIQLARACLLFVPRRHWSGGTLSCNIMQ